jgi:hypothetical protein
MKWLAVLKSAQKNDPKSCIACIELKKKFLIKIIFKNSKFSKKISINLLKLSPIQR